MALASKDGPAPASSSVGVIDPGLAYVAGGTVASPSGAAVTAVTTFGYLTLILDPSAAFGSVLFGVTGKVSTSLPPGVPITMPLANPSLILLAAGSGSVGLGVTWSLLQ